MQRGIESQAPVKALVVNPDRNTGSGAVDPKIMPTPVVIYHAQLPAPYETAEEQTQR
jgi:hypothetical protein